MNIRRSLLAVLVLCTGATNASAQTADWVSDWFDSSTSTSAGGYQSQQRGYYTLGSFQGRWRLGNDYLVSATPPSYKVGCGGVDLFGGAMSYLDPEYLVEKLERIVQAAPAFAFNLALQEFCKPCVAAMEALESITDQLNSMQINDCRLSQRLAAVMVKPGDDSLDALKSEVASSVSVGDGLRKNLQSFNDAMRGAGNRLPDDTKIAINGCDAVFRDTFANGSIIDRISARMGLADYADTIRGVIGDVVVTPAGNDYLVQTVGPCSGNDALDAADFVSGQFERKALTGACSPSGADAIVTTVDDRLTGIVSRMQTGTALTTDDVAFIENSPLPVFAALRDSVIAGTSPSVIAQLREPLAVAFGHKMMDDLLRSIQAMARKAQEIQENSARNPTSTERCEPKLLQKATLATAGLADGAREQRKALHANYAKKTAEMLAHLQTSRELLELRRQTLNKQATAIKQ
jgi:conjugative transfer pilus assembly protein TraH